MIKPDTKQIFADAIVELSKTKPLEKITVQNIVDYCEAGRQTFYNHFKDKEDLIAYVFMSDEKKCLEHLKKDYTLEERLALILNTFIEKKHFYVPSGQNSLGDVIFEHYYRFHIIQVSEKYGEEVIDKRLENAIRFYCCGSIYSIKKWMKNGMKTPSEEILDMIIDNIPERLKKYL